jgi:hypothetical protein
MCQAIRRRTSVPRMLTNERLFGVTSHSKLPEHWHLPLGQSRICIEGLWLTWDLRANDLFSRLGQKFAFIPEEAAGILSQIFFWWMHPLLREGYSARLNLATLPEIDEALSSQGLRKRALRFWVGRCNSLKPFEDAVQC